jgi:lipoate-protein ligase B
LSKRHGISLHSSEHTGVFHSPVEKLASIGMQVRHRLTSHGFAVNITNEPLAWFDRVIACGLEGVQAASVQSAREKNIASSEKRGASLSVTDEMRVLAEMFGEKYDKEVCALEANGPPEIVEEVKRLEVVAESLGDWAKEPLVN